MSYASDLTQIAGENRAEIQTDLAAARVQCETARSVLEDATRRVRFLESLLNAGGVLGSAAKAPSSSDPKEKMTLHAAMQQVLRDSPTGKLRAGEIIAEIERLGLYRMRDGRLPESQQIHARAGHYPELIGKDGPYFYAK